MTLHEIIEEIKDMEREIRFPEDFYEAGKKDAYCAVLDLLTKAEAEQPVPTIMTNEMLMGEIEPEQPSLPEGLEEAAQHDAILTYKMPEDGDFERANKTLEARIFHEIGFKAGAKWMAEQINKK